MVSLGISVHTFKSFVKFKTSGLLSCVSLTVTMVMTCHFLTQLLITLPLSLSEISNCVLFFSHELPILRYAVKISVLRIYENKLFLLSSYYTQ